MQPSKTVQYDPLTTVMFGMRSTKSGLNALILQDRAQDLLRPDNLANSLIYHLTMIHLSFYQHMLMYMLIN